MVVCETPSEAIPVVGGNPTPAQQNMRGLSLRPSSVVLVRLNGNVVGMPSDEKPSWWDAGELDVQMMTMGDVLRLVLDTVLLLLVPVMVFLVAYFSSNRALAFVYSVCVAVATYEYVWLAYRVRLRVFLPFKLHQKQTCRDIYGQIMSYSVDLRTCAITPIAERFFCGRKFLTAMLFSVILAGTALGFCFVFPGAASSDGLLVVAYVSTNVFLCVMAATLSPNVPDAIVVVVRYAYYCLASMNVLLKSATETTTANNRPVTIESYSLLMLSSCLMLIIRVMTSKEAMESAVMALLDVAGMLYLSCAAVVLEYFSRSPTAMNDHALLGFFIIVWSSELGSFLTERILKRFRMTNNHPIAKHVSSRQNVEKLIGSLLLGVSGSFIASATVNFEMVNYLVAILAATAIVFSQVCKLFLISLKKVAKTPATGEYLRIGGGVIDRIDTLLFMAIVFCPFFERKVFD
ncbi:TPA: hypothetical protein N0F65_004748 [Lagenidium giganteum]|uniref:Phosphatidate cytidylyltransferase n=1 Tax=Lagenidium giganteum TaxID=4803 RepID=A0AAV2YUU8_9STRA|nr:TPA: hypothetical protein N0F65_004748 [Lagenidium giganteum]